MIEATVGYSPLSTAGMYFFSVSLIIYRPTTRTKRTMPLYAIIDGLPGSGKNYMCNMISKLGYTVADVDDFSQAALAKDMESCEDFYKNFEKTKRKINEFIKAKKNKPVVLCGIATMLGSPDFTDGPCTKSIVDCPFGCTRIWLDVVDPQYKPSKTLLKQIYAALPELNKHSIGELNDLLESTRRAVLREFRDEPSGMLAWANMSKEEKRTEGVFWELPIPKSITRKGINEKEARKLLFDTSLGDFISQFKRYFMAMLEIQVEDGVHNNRARAIGNGFAPMRPDDILRLLQTKISRKQMTK